MRSHASRRALKREAKRWGVFHWAFSDLGRARAIAAHALYAAGNCYRMSQRYRGEALQSAAKGWKALAREHLETARWINRGMPIPGEGWKVQR